MRLKRQPIVFLIERVLLDLVYERVERSGLPAARRTDGKQDALRSSEDRVETLFDLRPKAKLRERHQRSSTAQHSDDILLAPPCWKDGHADVEPAGTLGRNVAILRDAALADIEPGQNFDSYDQVFVHPSWNFERFLEETIQPAADSSGRLARLDMDIAGIHRRRFFEDHFLNSHDWRTVVVQRACFITQNQRR